jgi:hypothetical protein
MSKTILLLLTVLLIPACSAGAGTDPVEPDKEPAEIPEPPISQAYRKAVEVKDFEAVMDLICWDRVEDEMRDMYRARLEKTADRAILKVELKPADFKEAVSYKRNGKTYTHNLTLTGWLVVKYAGEGVVEGYIPLGEKDGRTMITMAAPKP